MEEKFLPASSYALSLYQWCLGHFCGCCSCALSHSSLLLQVCSGRFSPLKEWMLKHHFVQLYVDAVEPSLPSLWIHTLLRKKLQTNIWPLASGRNFCFVMGCNVCVRWGVNPTIVIDLQVKLLTFLFHVIAFPLAIIQCRAWPTKANRYSNRT